MAERTEPRRLEELPLAEFVPALSPQLRAPTHAPKLLDLLERSPRGGLRWLCSFPIRHHKTVTIQHAIAKWLKCDPTLRVIFMTHSALYAASRGRGIRELAERAGVNQKRGHNTLHDWRTEQGGGVYVMSALQSALGQDVDVLIVDDPFEGPLEADDPEIRQRVDETIAFYTSRLSQRGSVGIVMSRFHPDDAIGRRLRRTAQRWEYVHHRALIDEGLPTEQAFAPEIRTLEELHQIRAELREIDPTERTWWSQWQNEPRADSGDLFKQPTRYLTLPEHGGFRDIIGVDMAFSVRRSADWFAIVVLRAYGGTGYVTSTERFRADPSIAMARLRATRDRIGKYAPIYSYMSGPEVGVARYLADQGLQIQTMPARYDKRTRAQRTIDAWNAGRLLVPSEGCDDFVERAASFRGVDGDDDDEIDALVSAWDGGVGSRLTVPRTFGSPRC